MLGYQNEAKHLKEGEEPEEEKVGLGIRGARVKKAKTSGNAARDRIWKGDIPLRASITSNLSEAQRERKIIRWEGKASGRTILLGKKKFQVPGAERGGRQNKSQSEQLYEGNRSYNRGGGRGGIESWENVGRIITSYQRPAREIKCAMWIFKHRMVSQKKK